MEITECMTLPWEDCSAKPMARRMPTFATGCAFETKHLDTRERVSFPFKGGMTVHPYRKENICYIAILGK
jgi:hypothetical protein